MLLIDLLEVQMQHLINLSRDTISVIIPSMHMKPCLTNSFMVNAHILPTLDSRVQHRPCFCLIIHHKKYFPPQ